DGQVTSVELSMRARLRAGEAAAFGELFDQYARAVYHHGYRLTGDRCAAEDVLSETFLQSWRARERIDDDGGSLLPWLLGIATNTIRNQHRRRRRESGLLARLAPHDTVPDFADELVGRLDDATTLATIPAALRSLRPAEREVVALCVWAGLDYASAAQALGVPVGTVRSRLSRARRKLTRLSARGKQDGEPRPAERQVVSGRLDGGWPAREVNR